MLLQALLKRLNGGSDTASTRVASRSRQSSQFVYEKFRILPELLLKLIRHQSRESSSALHAQRIFPALEIIEHFGVPKQNGEEVWQALNQYRANSIWSIREKAAGTIGIVIISNEISETIQSLVHSSGDLGPNETHGRLMTLRVLFNRALPSHCNQPKGRLRLRAQNVSLKTAEAPDSGLLDFLFELVDKYVTETCCPIIIIAALNIVMDVAESITGLSDDSISLDRTQNGGSYLVNIEFEKCIDQIYHLLEERKASFALSGPQVDLQHVSASDTVLQSLLSLERVIALGESRTTANTANKPESRHVQSTLALNLSYNSLREEAGNQIQSDEDLQIWGDQIARAFLESAGVTIYFVPWIRALLLALNAYSVRTPMYNILAALMLNEGNFCSSRGRCIY